MYKVLVCDDDIDITAALKIYLETEGYAVEVCHNGSDALELIKENEIHCVLLDIMMPIMDGMATLNQLRETLEIPVILISAKSELTDKILGLNCGADDYITKPFNPVEVLARVRSQIRRYTRYKSFEKEPDAFVVGAIELSDSKKIVKVAGDDVKLTPIEYSILKCLIQRPGHVFSMVEIFNKIWEETSISAETSIPVHIRHLREKIEINPAKPRYIHVVWGQGYKIEEVKL